MDQDLHQSLSTWEPRLVHRVGKESLPEAVRRAILELIRHADLPDEKLPGEDQIAATFNVSRPTVRDALKMLEREAIVARKHGVGTFVNRKILDSGIAINRLVTFTDLIEDAGHSSSARVVSAQLVSPQTSWSGPELAGNARHLVEVDKVYYADLQPIIFVRDAFPVTDQLRISLDLGRIPTSVFEFAKDHLNRVIDHTVAEIDIVSSSEASELTQTLLGSESSSWLYLREVHYTNLGDALGRSIVVLNPKGPVTMRILRRN